MMVKENQPPRPDMATPHRAGDSESFAGGKVSYLSPGPLPTGAAPVDFNQAIGEVNDVYLDLGGSLPTPFTWQLALGGPFTSFLIVAFLFPFFGAAVFFVVSNDVGFFFVGWNGLFQRMFGLGVGGECLR
ncbi:hypothetical protein [Halomonas nitroreducens]|uniref:Uncharacterized protein n=1 Tax=Halomonas nitroreducens TaxID=447425 RepID=A0A431UZV1_9GAMM|nr:hypothetical protein [Halomonas nitroreducens]RTQ99928.1 hypothetical protein EKG36_17030 [Halomonas nitroreducens]